MLDPSDCRLCKDPHLPWQGSFPYQRLNATLQRLGKDGIGPHSSMLEVDNALFALQAAEDSDPVDKTAWDELHNLERRLLLDFCQYQLPVVAEPDEPSAEIPLDVPMTVLRQLASTPPIPVEVLWDENPREVPKPEPLDAKSLLPPLPPANIGEVTWDEDYLIGTLPTEEEAHGER